jgi:hypothetical protein
MIAELKYHFDNSAGLTHEAHGVAAEYSSTLMARQQLC